MIEEFKSFIARGNVLDLAVALIMGAAFGGLVSSFTQDVLMQAIAAIFGQPNFSSLTFNIANGVIAYVRFINAIINFLIVAIALFLLIKAFNNLRKPSSVDLTTKECPFCLSTIPTGATRCPNCTSDLDKADGQDGLEAASPSREGLREG